jgi:glycosyltransferase involved in cell wall biosynthesis
VEIVILAVTLPYYDSAIDEIYPVEFSIITTSYYEEKSIDEFVSRLLAAMRQTGRSFEIILVNDGSTDKTFDHHRVLFEQNPEIAEAIDFYRNTGQLCAMSCGVAHARGQNFVFLDSDLQLDPEELPMLIQVFDEGYDIVSGVRVKRKDPLARRITSWLANRVIAKVARHPLTDFGCTFKVYRGDLVRAFDFGPFKAWKTAFVFAQATKVREVPITHHARPYGKSGWTFSKLSRFLFDHIVGISSRPFQRLSILSLIFGFLILVRILFGLVFPGAILSEVSNGLILNVLAANIFIMLAGLSAVGEFTFRIYNRSERDPIYIIRRRLSRTLASQPADLGR